MGDQPQAIEKLVRHMRAGEQHSVLLGVTGSGKTFTMANVVAGAGPADAGALAQQDAGGAALLEFKQFFPDNAVEYFVSYFDYYQPEAYIPRSDTYIEKDSSMNEEIERLRLSATSSLLTRRDTLVVASVSCIYGLGSPDDYKNMICTVREGAVPVARSLPGPAGGDAVRPQRLTTSRAANSACAATWWSSARPTPRTRCAWNSSATRSSASRASIRCRGDTMEELETMPIFAARHYVTPADKMRRAQQTIRMELEDRIARAGKAGQAAGGAAAEDAHDLRSRDDGGDGLLQRHRELFAPHQRPARRARGRSR